MPSVNKNAQVVMHWFGFVHTNHACVCARPDGSHENTMPPVMKVMKVMYVRSAGPPACTML